LLPSLLAAVLLAASASAAPSNAEALVILIGDQHSAYERTAQFVARVDQLHADNPALPLAVLIDGDTQEWGNVIARRSHGLVDFAMLEALARRAPTVLNLGNHEPEFFDLGATVKRVEATGAKVVTNLIDRTTGRPAAPASLHLPLGRHDAVIVGIVTDRLTTFRLAVRPQLDLADPVVWSRKNLPSLLAGAEVPIVLSHAGLRPDREILPLVPDGTLFAGAHDHLRFVHPESRTVYVHSGSWNETFTVAWLCRGSNGANIWQIEQSPIRDEDPADRTLATLIAETRKKFGEPADRVVVGRRATALDRDAAARFVVQAVRAAAQVDAALIGNTTFGAGLPAGDITRLALDACVRFDGSIFTADVDGVQLRDWLAHANQTADTPWAERRGDFLFADASVTPEPGRRYRVAVADWVAHNAKSYLDTDVVAFTEQPSLKLKAIVASALAR
jgi:5'-nucleotidase / UDP-sugar diphosphatase